LVTLADINQYIIEDSSICFLNGIVDSNMAEYFIRFIIEKNCYDNGKPKPNHLKVIINSPGGIISDCFAMIDIMNAYPIPIYTYGAGLVASCGLILFLSGNKGNRYIFKNASILSHQWSSGSEGKDYEIKAASKEHKLITKRIYNIYENATGLSKKEIEEKLLPPEDKWLSPHECIKLKLCDKIISKI
jgi:ATP-dependent Clp protease protease subunit